MRYVHECSNEDPTRRAGELEHWCLTGALVVGSITTPENYVCFSRILFRVINDVCCVMGGTSAVDAGL